MRAIGPIGSWVLATEVFGWREIRHGRELGAIVGLVPALSQSGETRREQGITRAGNAHVRRVMVQLAWTWVRVQPTSALTQWYQRRFGSGGPRTRRIVAVARKLLVALLRYVETGVVPGLHARSLWWRVYTRTNRSSVGPMLPTPEAASGMLETSRVQDEQRNSWLARTISRSERRLRCLTRGVSIVRSVVRSFTTDGFIGANRLTRLSGSLRFGASSWSVGSIWGKSGPPNFLQHSPAAPST